MIITGFTDYADVQANFYFNGTLLLADKYFDVANQTTGAILTTRFGNWYIIGRLNSDYGTQSNGEIQEYISKTDLKNFLTYNPDWFPNIARQDIFDLLDN